MLRSVAEGQVHLPTRRDLAAYLPQIRSEKLFRNRLRELRRELQRERRGELWLTYGPAQLRDFASDRVRSERVLGSVRRLESVLPASSRGIVWALLLDETVELLISPDGPQLPRQQWDQLLDVARARLFGRLSASEQKFLERTLPKIDTGTPPLIAAAWAAHDPPQVGTPVSVNPSSTAVASWPAVPSVGGWPVVAAVASVPTAGQVLLEPIHTPSRSPRAGQVVACVLDPREIV